MSIENEKALFQWLINELSPLSDAEPDTLANYVVALVKKQKEGGEEEKKKFMVEQLVLFLNEHTQKFVDKCLEVLSAKSYIEQKKSDPQTDEAPTSSVKAEVRKEDEPAPKTRISEKKRKSPTKDDENSKEDDRSGAGPASRPTRRRISPPSPDRTDNKRRRVSKSPQRERRRRRSDERRDRRRSRSRSGSRSPSYRRSGRDSRKKRCKDFDELGFCKKGDKCQYDHGTDPMIVDTTAAASVINFPPGINFSVPPPTYLVAPPGVDSYNPAIPPPVVGAECYNPEAPGLITPATNFSVPPPTYPAWNQRGGQMIVNAPGTVVGSYSQTSLQQQHVYNGGGRGAGAVARGRGGFQPGGPNRYQNGGAGGRGSGNDGTMLQVKLIPPEMNTIAKLNEHFATFGTVENIQVRYGNDPKAALIKFSNRFEAQNAYKSPTPVFSNRFIKVFWHNEDASNGAENGNGIVQNGQQAENRPPPAAAPPPPQKFAKPSEAKFVSEEVKEHRAKIADANARYNREREQLQVLIDLQKKNTEMVDKLMQKQKILLTKARTAPEEADRQKATTLIKKVHAKLKTLKAESDEMLVTIGDKTQALEDAKQLIETIKASRRETSVEKEDPAATESIVPDTNEPRLVLVKGVPENDIGDVVTYMERFGELGDWSCGDREELGFVASFPFKKASDAKKAMEGGRILNGIALEMELQSADPLPVEISETTVDDVQDANLSAGQLLAAVDGDQYDE